MRSRVQTPLLALAFALVASGCGDNRTGNNAGRIDAACTSNAECLETELCATGLCEGGLGTCRPRPTECDDVTSFVCGCDGRTYQNTCFAEQAGVRLAQTGACGCEVNEDCDPDQFCALANSCLNPGSCRPRPMSCQMLPVEPVCGCDNVTYETECAAFEAGVRVSASAPCECTSNSDCAMDEFCSATVCDGPGFCESRNVACPPEGGSATGCDGVVYPSACDANRAGERVRPPS